MWPCLAGYKRFGVRAAVVVQTAHPPVAGRVLMKRLAVAGDFLFVVNAF